MTNPFLPLATAAVLAFGTAFAADLVPLTVNDSGVDYRDADTAYMSLSQSDGDLVITLDDVASADALPAISVDVPVRVTSDAAGDDAYTGVLDGEGNIEVVKAGPTVRGIDVVHPDIALGALVERYTDALQALGFDVSGEASSNGNLATLDAIGAAGTLRLNFHRLGSDVSVHLATL